MKWYCNLKISVKLIVGFFIVALISGIVGVIGIVNYKDADTKYGNLFNNYGTRQGNLGLVNVNFQGLRVDLRSIILEKDPNSRSKYKDILNKDADTFEESLKNYESTILTNEERSIFNNLKSSYNQFQTSIDKVVDLAMAGQTDQALELMHETTKYADAVNKYFIDDVTLNRETGIKLSNDLSNNTNRTIIIMIAIIVIAMIGAIALGLFISRVINNPIRKLIKESEKIADGDLNVNIAVETKDEIGLLQKAFKTMVDNTNDVMQNINAAAEQVASGSKQVSASSIALSQGATEQASSIEELTASIEEISSQTKLNADNADQANELAEKAQTNAMQGNEQMKGMLKAMDEINEASGNISKIIKVIDEIAFQTNILALNAAVEAARAGQHGKGFAVVAEEVRNLAARSANAAKETTAMIEGSIKKVEGGTKIANETAVALNMIVEDVAKAASLVSDIAAASNEQATGIAQVTQGIAQVSQVVQTNSATSQESAAASAELSSQAELLKDQVNRFKIRENSGSYNSLKDISPEVLKMLENMTERKRANVNNINESKEGAAVSKINISLSDNEFGKY